MQPLEKTPPKTPEEMNALFQNITLEDVKSAAEKLINGQGTITGFLQPKEHQP